MGDQRIEARPPLRRVYAGDRTAIGGVRPQAVDRLGRKGDEASLRQEARGFGDGG
ncbi:hypothetical protein LMIY3S_00890 [Labrys miyagiensis]